MPKITTTAFLNSCYVELVIEIKMKNILIVDDSAEVRENLAKLLKTIEGVRLVGEAFDYISGIDRFDKLKPDIIILDIDLPAGTGIQVLSEVKKISPSTIIIMFTNYSNHVIKKLAIRQGANYFLDKSIDIDKLADILTELAY